MFSMKLFADDILNETQIIEVVFNMIENIMGKEENDGYHHFVFFAQCCHTGFFLYGH